ncbi:tetratricopeptide repeat protein [Tunturiibacter gelidiferens]|uniref:tetratricopeptide repeat protein n=1 Tax=Tunturiibacter gelidiferens TaxID=3069689 RepID=UPI003D9BADA8
MLGKALDANGRPEDALPFYQKALSLAKTVQPAFQISSVADLEQRLKTTQR